jgi:hypothetical protein
MACVDATKRAAVFHILLTNGAYRVGRNTRRIYEGCGGGYLSLGGVNYDRVHEGIVEEGAEQVTTAKLIE